ncbi:MAG TPA: hypothetical protein DCF63_04130 [Planctomycetaceae bacterium]|nr:hypothetical protein [Planctomycetaceae bacterium]
MEFVEIKSLCVQHGPLSVVENVDLSVQQGERLVILGPSGAGKTTLLRAMAGLVLPTSGHVLIEGQAASQIPIQRRSVAWLSQDYALYPQLTVQQNLEVALKQKKLSLQERSDRLQQVDQWFRIGDLRDRLPSQLSGGQAQRVAFAKAMAIRPKLLLLDEPLSQLDGQLRQQLLQRFVQALCHFETTVCWIAHDPWEAFAIATRLAVLEQGRLIQTGSPKQVYQRPGSRVAAELCSPWGVNWVPKSAKGFQFLQAHATTGKATVGVRPEHWKIGEASSSNGAASLVVREIRYLGFAQLVSGLIEDIRISVLDPSGTIEVGQELKISVHPDHLIWIDEKRLS